MKILLLLARRSPVIFLFAISLSIVSGFSTAWLISLINSFINSEFSLADSLAEEFLFFCILMLVTRALAEILLVKVSQEIITDLRESVFQNILSAPLVDIENIGNSRLLSVFTEDIQTIHSAFSIFPTLCAAVAIVCGCLFYLAYLSQLVFVGFLLFMGLGILTYNYIATKAEKSFYLARMHQEEIVGHFQTVIHGIKELKLNFGRTDDFKRFQLSPVLYRLQKENVTGLSIFSVANSWGQLLFFVAIGCIIFGLPSLIDIPTQVMSGYVMTILFLLSPLNSAMRMLPITSQASVALDQVELTRKALASQPEIIFTEISEEPKWNSLEVINVEHEYYQEYKDKNFVLGPINLTINAGELIFLTGGNGSGKSTLAKLLTGLYNPKSGEIRVDGKAVGAFDRSNYRQKFSAIFSDFHLFDRMLGVDYNISAQRIRSLLKALELDHKVDINEGSFSTIKLSQGQRKRLALLVSYLEDRSIYLFDEWASDQDPVFKEVFYTKILKDLKNAGKTVIAITHDDQYFYVADRLYKLNYGQLVEQ
jgi:putative ATP-binding cassette transporter